MNRLGLHPSSSEGDIKQVFLARASSAKKNLESNVALCAALRKGPIIIIIIIVIIIIIIIIIITTS